MNPAEVVAAIEAAGGVLGAVGKVADEFDKLVGKVDDVRKKVRWLKITIVNMSPTQSLLVDDSWFDSGRFWEQPFSRIQPGSALSFFVCDNDGSIMCGVTGGVGLSAYDRGGPSSRRAVTRSGFAPSQTLTQVPTSVQPDGRNSASNLCLIRCGTTRWFVIRAVAATERTTTKWSTSGRTLPTTGDRVPSNWK